MNEIVSDFPDEVRQSDKDSLEAARQQQIAEFVRTNPDYYVEQFGKIDEVQSLRRL